MKIRKEKSLFDSQGEYNEEINDKLNDLWTQMKQKKNQIIKTITPAYSRKSQNSCFVDPLQYKQNNRESMNNTKKEKEFHEKLIHAQNQISKLKEKLTSEFLLNKSKDQQIINLKKALHDTQTEKNQLILEIHNLSNVSNVEKPQEISNQLDGLTSEANKTKSNENEQLCNESTIYKPNKKNNLNYCFDQQQALNSDKDHLLELLRTTEEYKQFVFYMDNNQLSYLRTLNRNRKRNCNCNYSEKQKTLWAPKDVISVINELNSKHQMNLSKENIEKIVYNINLVYLHREKQKISELKYAYEKKIKQLERTCNQSIPYDILQIQKHKERQLTKNKERRKSTKATISNNQLNK